MSCSEAELHRRYGYSFKVNSQTRVSSSSGIHSKLNRNARERGKESTKDAPWHKG